MTLSAQLKMRVSEDLEEHWAEIDNYADSMSEDMMRNIGMASGDAEATDNGAGVRQLNPTYEMVTLKRQNEKKQSLDEIKSNAKDMFALFVS